LAAISVIRWSTSATSPGPGWGLQVLGVEELPVGVLDLGLHPGQDLGHDVPGSVDETPLPQGLGEGLLDRGDQAGRAVGDDQQRGGQAAVGEEVMPGVGALPGAGGQAEERGLAIGGDAPGGQDRLGRGAGVHPEERGVQVQVVQGDAVQPAPRPGLVFVLDLAADRRHRGLGDRGLITQRLGQGGLDVADRQAGHERGDHQRFQRVRLGHVRPEQPGRERLAGAAQLGPGQLHRPGRGLDRDLPVPIPRSGPGIVAGCRPLVAVTAEEPGDLRFEGGLHQQLRAEPGDVFQDLRQLLARREWLVDVAADALGGGYSVWHGRRSFPSMTWRS
jgi:hypothetical protein